MKVRFPLYAQILSFLILHLGVLVIIFLFFFNAQFGIGWEPLITSPIGERVESIAFVIMRQTQGRPVSTWNTVLEGLGKFYGVKFAIFDAQGCQLAGDSINLPPSVMARIIIKRMHHPYFEPLPPNTVSPKPEALIPSRFQISSNFRMVRAHGRFLLHTTNPDRFWIGVHMHVRQPSDGPATLLAVSDNLWQTKLFLDFGLFLAAIIAVLLLSVLIWLPFVYRITQALSKLTTTTEKIAEGKFDTALQSRGWDEIGSLTEAINSMAKRLNNFVTGQKRFLGDIAHELRSPIARLQFALELLESSGTPAQEQTMRDIREEVEEMSNLINELLAFSKAGLQGRETQLTCLDLEPLLKAAVAKTCSDSLVTMELAPGLQVLGDRLLLERALGNILRNAVRYAGNCGPITLKATRNGKEVNVVIIDCGPGVPEEALKMLGEPFFRPEASRSRSSGGVGLGLAIVKTCIEACEGSFRVCNNVPLGLKVQIVLKYFAKHDQHDPQETIEVTKHDTIAKL